MYVINFLITQIKSTPFFFCWSSNYYYNFLHSISWTACVQLLFTVPNLDLEPKLHTLSSRGFSSSSKWGLVHPDPKKRWWPGLKNNFSLLRRPQFGLKIRWKLWPLSEIHHAIPDGELCKFDVQSSDQFPLNNDNWSGQTKDSDFYTLPWIKLLESPAAQNYLVVACI